MESKVTFVDLLTLLFVGLKLTHNINWNWAWIVSPMIIALFSRLFLKRLFGWAQKRKGLQEKT